jgi:hypothetical protein
MKRAAILLIALTMLTTTALRADEGMWQPSQLPELSDELRALGLEIDPAKLSSLTEHPMGAVISLLNCTASFVSSDGLVVTNHHCAYGSIQHNSTEERNLLTDGFLAAKFSEELPARPGSRVMVTVDVQDVTERINKGLSDKMTGRDRYQAVADAQKKLVATCEKDPGHRCNVYSFHGGLSYKLIKQMEILDVRLVYAPSNGIGNYGGDIDNWMWPRHTGDFSFYRAYVGKDGKPAPPSEENVPYKPKHWLTVATDGVKDGDFVMAVGYPGSTSRYRLAAEVENQFGWTYPTQKRLFLEWLDILSKETGNNADAKIKYAGLDAGLNNASKNYEGMLIGFAKSDAVEKKKRLESDLQKWIDSDPGRKAKYSSALEDLRSLVAKDQATRERGLYYEYMARRGELLRTARTLYRLSHERGKPDLKRESGYQERDIIRIQERLKRIDRGFDPAVDRVFWKRFIMNYAGIPAGQHVAVYDQWFGIDGNHVNEAKLDSVLDEMYSETTLGDSKARLDWMTKAPSDFEKSDDPFIKLAVRMFESDMTIENEDKEIQGLFEAARSRYMTALIAFLKSQGKPVYPDANGSLRVTYGTVKGYSPRDAVSYTPFTTLRGIAEKNTGEEPFNAPKAQIAAMNDTGATVYVDKTLGEVPVNFLSTLDSTGGSSGSPTLNGKAELVGLLFDGNWESIIADWDFIPALTRAIQVDIRYTLWIMENIDGAHNLLREMGVPTKSGTSAQLGG